MRSSCASFPRTPLFFVRHVFMAAPLVRTLGTRKTRSRRLTIRTPPQSMRTDCSLTEAFALSRSAARTLTNSRRCNHARLLHTQARSRNATTYARSSASVSPTVVLARAHGTHATTRLLVPHTRQILNVVAGRTLACGLSVLAAP